MSPIRWPSWPSWPPSGRYWANAHPAFGPLAHLGPLAHDLSTGAKSGRWHSKKAKCIVAWRLGILAPSSRCWPNALLALGTLASCLAFSNGLRPHLSDARDHAGAGRADRGRPLTGGL